MGADGIKSDTFIEAAGDSAEGVYASGPATSASSAYDTFLSAYVDAYGEEPPAPFAPESYDALNVILKAIEASAVKADDGTLYIGRQALRDAMYNVAPFDGLSGKIQCNDTGDCSTAGVEFAQVQNGEWAVVQ